MNYWFECKVSYERQADGMGMKKVSELYLVDAMSFTEAEERVIKEIQPLVSIGELEVSNIKRVKLAELFLNEREEADHYYKARVNFITIDEKSGMEKKAGVNMLIKSESLSEAVTELVSQMEKQLGAYEIASITDTQILDVFRYGAQ
ncbi:MULTISPECIES: DUF4494 domain-containing protein [unclassified Porphyromonas]|uniref:DUF4494 domain-containing protein n=1 Tax=unclassified Porphyromonas TaxID=2645799 RepID=UPI00052B8DE6|nr:MULTISPECIES: DUF4494 domain-containing protein [unclassified Porphyromonas]KGN82258.1 phage tail protein [Porphyromonas sp. COT-290 OH860]KGO00749.1 phage tail protein [Porphyromonas sp. COT-290 OH3588]